MAEYRALLAEAHRRMTRSRQIKARRPQAATSKWLFPSFGESGHLTRQHFARELKALAAGADCAPTR